MPLQNRVTPFGEIVADPARGTLMGNRGGCLHDGRQQLRRRRWVSERWITCLLEYRGWHREVMRPGHYTELFFLDEATALAAGHRPCALCRRVDFDRFRQAWLAGNPAAGLPRETSISAIDRVLHAERGAPGWGKRTFEVPTGQLPEGVMVAAGGDPFLWWRRKLSPWTLSGYGDPVVADTHRPVTVLTPASIVAAIRAGYRPAVHESLK